MAKSARAFWQSPIPYHSGDPSDLATHKNCPFPAPKSLGDLGSPVGSISLAWLFERILRASEK